MKNYTPLDESIKALEAPISKAKEAEPIPSAPEKLQIKEVVEHEPEKEVEPFIQIKSETIELPPDLKKLGLTPVSSTQFPSYQNIKLPVSDDKIIKGLHSPITTSLRWLATLALYILQQAHLTLKVIHGKAVRVLRR